MNLKCFDASFWQTLENLVQSSQVIIDRPKGTPHPRYPDFTYPLNYGYLKGTTAMDGHGIDVWQGTNGSKKIDAILCTVDFAKKDAEIKILISCSEEEKETIYREQNKDGMNAILIRRD